MRADLVVIEDLRDVRAAEVYAAGRLVARDGQALLPSAGTPAGAPAPVRVRWDDLDLSIAATGRRVRVIGAVPGQLVTEHLVEDATLREGRAVADASCDRSKIAVIERHHGTGRVGLGFVRGIGLARGAIAGTVAHDHHNLVLIGADDRSMLTAGRAVAQDGGGLAVALGDAVLARLPLPIAGLMSDRTPAQVAGDLDHLVGAARSLGSSLADPFMTMSFLALEVIPHLKLTDRGLVDVDAMSVVSLFADDRGVP
jgi:adenine deaminase